MGKTGPRERFSKTTVESTVRQALLTGFALTIPLFVTLLVLGFVVNFISNALDPLASFVFGVSSLQRTTTGELVLKSAALVVLVTGVLGIGFVAERRSGAGRIEDVFDATIQRVPGIGSLYTSFDEMSDMLLDDDTQSFQEVVLVEYPTEGSFAVAFVTAGSPEEISEATGHDEMVTLFMPMAPNPVMGGYVVHVAKDRVYDVDLTVEEGIRSIVTSGVAIGEKGAVDLDAVDGVSLGEHPAEAQYRPADAAHGEVPRTDPGDREGAYEAAVDPEHVDTPERVVERATATGDTATDDTVPPAEFEQSGLDVGDDAPTPDDIERAGGEERQE